MDTEAIRVELREVRDKIRALKGDFSKLRDQKENHFNKGEEHTTEINSLYEEVKAIETEHNLDKVNEELEARKTECDELKKSIVELEKHMDASKAHAPKPVDRNAVKPISAEKAKRDLTQLDLKLQTQVLSLEKEAEVTKEIAHLKSILENSNGEDSSGTNSEYKKLRKDYSSIKKKFVNAERKIRSLYKQIRLISKEKKKRYKRIDDLRNERKKSFESFRVGKKEYSTLGKDLKDLFSKEEELMSSIGETAPKKTKKFGADKEIKKKQKEAEDMLLKKGVKLTTEDLLAFQTKR